MYTHYFQLKQAPFSIAPDPRYLFMSERHREALAHLLYGVDSGGGFVLLSGEIGAGKTTVCRCFMEQIPAHCKLAYIFNPKLSVDELLSSVCDEFGIALPPQWREQASVKVYVDAINAYLLASHARSLNNVLIIDEAQNLSADVLEQLRLLTNLETGERKLLQIILIGQPELRGMLARPELEPVAQRVIARYHLGSLSAAESANYVAHRMAVAGALSATPFPPRVLERIHHLSKGVPRRINLLCDRALLGAYVENRGEVTLSIVRQAAAEVFGDAGASAPAPAAPRWAVALAGVAAGLAIAGAAAWHWRPPSTLAPAPARIASTVVAAAAPALAAAPAAAPPASLDDAVRELAALWGQALPEGEPCREVAKLSLRCHQGRGGLADLRRLDRPAVLRLRDDPRVPSYAVLTGLGADGATLRIAGRERRMTLDALGTRVDGEFLTLWRAPGHWRDEVRFGDRGPDVDWLARRLRKWRGLAPPLDGRPLGATTLRLLREFQLSENLKADGVAGPKTFMRLMQLGGAKEPRLLAQADLAAGK